MRHSQTERRDAWCMIFSQLALSGTQGKKRLLSVKSRAASGCSSLPDRPSGGAHHEHTSIQTRYEVIGIKERGWRIPVEAGIKGSSFDYCSVFTGDSTTKINDCKGSTDKLRPILHGLQQTHTLMSPCWTQSCNSALWDFEKADSASRTEDCHPSVCYVLQQRAKQHENIKMKLIRSMEV